jgi:hypothetical protein
MVFIIAGSAFFPFIPDNDAFVVTPTHTLLEVFMKHILTVVFMVSCLSALYAQQNTATVPANLQQLLVPMAPATTHQTFTEPISNAFKKTNSRSPLKTLNDGELIGMMANCYAMLEDEQTQISYDPPTKSIAIVFRGNDRGTSNGNTLYMRYSTDNGVTWTAKGNNMSNTANPRYPQSFLFNPTKSTNTADVKGIMMWSSLIAYPGQTATAFGQVDVMKADIGNVAPSYGRWTTGGGLPAWNMPARIVPAYGAGKLFTHCRALDPANGNMTSDEFFLESSNGTTWNPCDPSGNPFITYSNITEYGVFASCFDVSPDGKNIIFAFIATQPYQGSTASAAWVDAHRIGYFESTDGGVTWPATPTLVSFGDMQGLIGELTATPKMGTELDVTYDADNNPHFLVLATGDINPLDAQDDAPTDSTISLNNVDSTFVSEVCRKNGQWYYNPVGVLRTIYLPRRCFSVAYTDGSERFRLFQHEFGWMRNQDRTKLYAKWVTPLHSLNNPATITINGTTDWCRDSISQLFVAGRHIGSSNGGATMGGWTTPAQLTNYTDIGVKFSKCAYYAGNSGELQLLFVEFGPSDFRDHDDDILTNDNLVWYIKNAQVDNVTVAVETLNDAPGAFALAQNYPNPFGPGARAATGNTSISFTLPRAGQTTLSVYNVLGQKVATLVESQLQAGTHRVNFDATNLPGGVYIYRLDSGSSSASRSMTIVR